MARFRVWLAGTAVLALLPGTAPPAVAAAAPAASAPRATAPVPRATVPGAPSADPIAHDPTLIKEGRYYYDIITGDIGTRTYLPVRRSTDLVHWTFLGPVFTTPPAWVTAELGLTPGDFWAPDINYFAGEYHLYYAASSFGTNNSVIGLATTPTLDPGSPAYHWTDRGMVIRSRGADNVNAIDPDVVFDAAGVPWLSFGSFWDGITMRRLDASSGLLSTVDTTAYRLASRGGASIEGPSIVRHGGYYYLFVSLDYCCRGVESDYRVVVGRSREVTGPYQDASGAAMLAGGGTEVLRGYNEFRGTGGGDIYQIHGVDLFAHHYYDRYDNGTPKLSVRAVSWRGGWPRLGDPLSGSRQLGRGSAYFTLVSRASGAVVENVGCGYEGAGIALAAGTGSPCQQWRPDDRDGGYVSLGNRFSNKVAEVAACVNADGARVAQWGWLANACQEYRFVPTGDGWLRVENRLAGRDLAPAGCGGAGAPIQTFTPTAEACQQFRLAPAGDVLIADAAGQRALGAVACGRTLATGRRTGACQLWRFTPASDGYYRIVNVHSGRPLGTLADGRLALAGRPGEWRIEPLNDGTYRLITRDGTVLDLSGQPRQQPTGAAVRLLAP